MRRVKVSQLKIIIQEHAQKLLEKEEQCNECPMQETCSCQESLDECELDENKMRKNLLR